MAYLDYTRPGLLGARQQTVCLTPAECEVLLPAMKAELARVQAVRDKHIELMNRGGATKEQQSRFFRAGFQADCLAGMVDVTEEFLNKFEWYNGEKME